VFYNATSTLSRHEGEIAALLARDLFSDVALPPGAAWLGTQRPGVPTMTVGAGPRGSFAASLAPAGTSPRWWVVRWRSQQRWTTQVLSGSERALSLVSPTDAAVDWVVINAVDATGAMSDDAAWRRQ
jgi:hypothetical protein